MMTRHRVSRCAGVALISSLGPSGFGTLLAMSGLGMAVGAVLVAQLGHRFSRRRLAAAGLGTITWTLLLLSQFKGSLAATLTLCGILGMPIKRSIDAVDASLSAYLPEVATWQRK